LFGLGPELRGHERPARLSHGELLRQGRWLRLQRVLTRVALPFTRYLLQRLRRTRVSRLDPVDVGLEAGQDRCDRRPCPAAVRVGDVEEDTFSCQASNRRCVDRCFPIWLQCTATKGVDDVDQDVRTRPLVASSLTATQRNPEHDEDGHHPTSVAPTSALHCTRLVPLTQSGSLDGSMPERILRRRGRTRSDRLAAWPASPVRPIPKAETSGAFFSIVAWDGLRSPW
jgi:hypothetical protein